MEWKKSEASVISIMQTKRNIIKNTEQPRIRALPLCTGYGYITTAERGSERLSLCAYVHVCVCFVCACVCVRMTVRAFNMFFFIIIVISVMI